MATITKKEFKISNKYQSVDNIFQKVTLKVNRLFEYSKKLFVDLIRLIFAQKREPTSAISKETYLKHQNSVKSNTNNSLRILY